MYCKAKRSWVDTRERRNAVGIPEAVNYDGQGKTMEQEVDDTMTMVAVVFGILVVLVLFWVVV